ncbi:MAG: glutathione S-transferase N-terminal domain-containing protein [Methylotenera sp.]|nr:glutathione S-transferase N-terminal domain-containing protein [Oligoflexia bacterium]
MTTSTVTLYTMNHCPFCERAKALLKQKGVGFQEVKLAEEDDAGWDTLFAKSGLKTMPQIFHGDTLIGGFTDLAALDVKDGLTSLK